MLKYSEMKRCIVTFRQNKLNEVHVVKILTVGDLGGYSTVLPFHFFSMLTFYRFNI